MQLYAVKFGESLLGAKYIFRDETSEDLIKISWSYYIAKYNNKTILFDVGFRDPIIANQWGIELCNVDDEVNKIIPNHVDVIFITHNHFDHIDNIDLFPDAQIIISYSDYLHTMESGNPIVQERLRKENVVKVNDTYLFDNKFRFKVVGGHTVGSSVIYFEHNNKDYVITGDECYIRDNLTQKRPIGVYSSSENNAAFINEASEKGCIPLPYHDITIFQTHTKVSDNIVQIF
ncbi:MBL fold metallo-hydrolase [Paenibacillus sp. PR3]|uniref:MBL fold metallo-hydrolase n=1 Tax=Paenibacillus terricola TaxID=2763503 RepID=A0ABR8N428_9BACL|nr:MBL fold metallo-hydrolase [Paenibacillus terricola]MBD3922931.1 MBL fold metallo-hydrolase [Paenibacillus terricola]